MSYFLREDLVALDKMIEATKAEIRKAQQEIGESCEQGSETWHDNPGYEEGQRAVTMWSRRLRQLSKERVDAKLVEPSTTLRSDGKAQIGDTITVLNLNDNSERQLTIGSAIVFDQTGKRISYKSPIGQILLGSSIGDVLDLLVDDRVTKLLVLDIQARKER